MHERVMLQLRKVCGRSMHSRLAHERFRTYVAAIPFSTQIKVVGCIAPVEVEG